MFTNFSTWVRTSITLKLIIIGILISVLLIPTNMVENLIQERAQTRDNVIEEVSSKWGLDQTIGTPVISIPYYSTIINSNNQKQTIVQYAHILPDDIKIKTNLVPFNKKRGLYEVVLYNTQVNIKGSFKSELEKLQQKTSSPLRVDLATIQVGVSDLKGLKDIVSFNINGDETYEFNPGVPNNDIYYSGMSFPINLTDKLDFAFECNLNLNGSTSLHYQPYGKKTLVELTAKWPDPSFEGYFLPDSSDIKDSVCYAKWQMLQLNRSYPQYGLGAFIRDSEKAASSSNYNHEDTSFGVRLKIPVDQYQKTNRTAKYAVMFILLTIVAFFFVEIIHKKRVHPIQYLLIGFAIIIFYVLLLSISEQTSFNNAYWISCSGVIVMIALYTQTIFKRFKISILIALILTTLYIFFFCLLQLQEYALIMGSIGLFIILGVTMYLTRNINWYKEDVVETPNELTA
jgi:inner membrane protein